MISLNINEKKETTNGSVDKSDIVCVQFNSNNGLVTTYETDRKLFLKRILSALFYGIASFLIIVVNKTVLTNYKFLSFPILGMIQMLTTILILKMGKMLKIISYPNYSRDVVIKIFPLPLLYVANLICGLGGTKHLSLPMFTVLRGFTILMTLIGEYYVLK
jgi:solute carrier family 35 protein